MPWGMTRPAAIQMIGPSVMLVAICAAEVSAIALFTWPTSEILWRVNLEWFHAIQKSSSDFNAYSNRGFGLVEAASLVFGIGLWGVTSNRPLPIAISTNLSFLYAVLLFCGAYMIDSSWLAASSSAELALCVILVAVSFLSAASSHIHYFRAIGSGF
jgi:hypothetical protein